MDELSLLDTFTQAYRRWWLVALLVITGGLAGWGIHRLQPPLYEAKAIIIAHIDFAQTGHLTELEQDQSILAVQALFVSDGVLQQVTDDIRRQDLPVTKLVYGTNLFLERRRSELSLIVRDRDSNVAAQIANLWVQRSFETLSEAHQHSLRAQEIRFSLYPAGSCPTPSPGDTIEGATCQPAAGIANQKADPAQLAELEKETLASKAIIPALVFGLSKKAQVPAQPVAYSDEILILAGALIGLLCGVLLASSSLPGSRGKKEQPRSREAV